MEFLGISSKIISKIIDFLVGIVVVLILLFSSYSLYTSLMLYNGAYVSESLLSMKPGTVDASSGKPKTFDDLRLINSDVKAWITVDNTHINYPIVQGKTNLEYINKDIYNKFALAGSIFMDSRNDDNFLDKYNLLYGHHIDNGSMFGDLQLFLDKSFFEKNKTGKLITEHGEYEVDFFLVAQADGYDKHIFNPSNVKSEEDKEEFIEYINSKKVYSRNLNIKKEDNIIALSTCTSTQTNGRTILYGLLKKK